MFINHFSFKYDDIRRTGTKPRLFISSSVEWCGSVKIFYFECQFIFNLTSSQFISINFIWTTFIVHSLILMLVSKNGWP